VNSWLKEMRTGSYKTALYWEDPKLGQRFHSLNSWEILDVSLYGDGGHATIQTASSTKGGIPIRKNWRVCLSKGTGEWKVSVIMED
jgi:hypothetical protein